MGLFNISAIFSARTFFQFGDDISEHVLVQNSCGVSIYALCQFEFAQEKQKNISGTFLVAFRFWHPPLRITKIIIMY